MWLFLFFFITFTLIFLRYLRNKGYFKRDEQNREKWKAYQQFVAEKHKLKWNLIFSRSLIVLFMLDFLFVRFYGDSRVGETLPRRDVSFQFYPFVLFFKSLLSLLLDEKYPKPYKLELQSLKSNLEATQSSLEMSKSELMLEREKSLDLGRRILNLERAKETETGSISGMLF